MKNLTNQELSEVVGGRISRVCGTLSSSIYSTSCDSLSDKEQSELSQGILNFEIAMQEVKRRAPLYFSNKPERG
jgi:hypothetical protein